MTSRLIALGVLFLFGGLACVLLGYMRHRGDLKFRDWPVTMGHRISGEIVRTTIARVENQAHSSSPRADTPLVQEPVWAFDVTYSYELGGRQHTGTRLTSRLLVENIRSADSRPSARMSALLSQFDGASDITVHYDPQDARESYVYYIDSDSIMRLYVIGAGCIAIGLLLLVIGKQLS